MSGRRQFGSIERLPSGRWRARYRVDGRVVQTGRTFATKADAGRFLDGVRADLDRGVWRNPQLGRVRFDVWVARFMATKQDRRPKTIAGYESLLRSRILPRFGSYELSKIRASDVAGWLADLGREGLSPSRRRQALMLLGQIMNAAVADGLLSTTPCAGIKPPPLPAPQPDYLTPDEVDALVAAAPQPWDLLILILFYGGLRWGEAVALRRADCNLLRSRIVVDESAAEVNGRVVFGPTKTHQRRTVSLPSFVRDRLEEHLSSEVGQDDGALVFTAVKGAPVRYSNFRARVWLPLTRSVGLEGIGTHIGRHTSATLLLAAGADVKDVQTHLGHKDAAMTLNVYCAPYEGKQDELAARLDAAWRTARGEAVAPVVPRGFHDEDRPRRRRSTSPRLTSQNEAPPAGFEPATHGLGSRLRPRQHCPPRPQKARSRAVSRDPLPTAVDRRWPRECGLSVVCSRRQRSALRPRPCRHAVGDRWLVDETDLKVAGVRRYLHRAIDPLGQVIDALVSPRRDARAARSLL
jgi:integrase